MSAARSRSATRTPIIVYLASGETITDSRKWVLESAGYAVTLATTTKSALTALRNPRRVDLLLVGSVNTGLDVPLVIEAARKRRPKIFIVSFSRRPGAKADFYIEPLAGAEALLGVVGEAIVTAHGHRFSKNASVMFVDRNRRYIHVTDRAAALVGYKRDELLGRSIDDISAPDMDVPGKFKSYVRDGSQHGVFSLRHRNGTIVRVRYAATVLDDGCMVSRLTRLSR